MLVLAACCSDSIDQYIRDTMELVKDVNEILTTIKDNVKDTQRILKTWEKNLMFERKDGRTYTFEELNDSFNQLIQQRWGLTGSHALIAALLIKFCLLESFPAAPLCHTLQRTSKILPRNPAAPYTRAQAQRDA